jgi:hypothetical protein
MIQDSITVESMGLYLLYRKYPDALSIRKQISAIRAAVPSIGRKSLPSADHSALNQKHDAIVAYERLLKTKSSEELTPLYQLEQEKQQEEIRLAAEQREKGLLYNQPYAAATFSTYEYYAKLATWTLDEAVTLLLGKNPKVVTPLSVTQALRFQVSSFSVLYSNLREMAQRATLVKQLYDPVLPSFFLAWARRKELVIPPELFSLVEKFCSPIADWQDAYQKQKEQFDLLLIDRDKLAEVAKRLIQERNDLKEKVAQLETAKAESDNGNEKATLSDSERHSLLKLVLGMAIDSYKYKPGGSRNTATGENKGSIAAALQKIQGLEMDADTIRKYIKEAEDRFKDSLSNSQ